MTIKECIDRINNLKPNQFSLEEKLAWLFSLEKDLKENVLDAYLLHPDEVEKEMSDFKPEHLGDELLVGKGFEEVYVAYLSMKIDEYNGETGRYNNSAIMFNKYYTDVAKWWNKSHRLKHHISYKFV